jgi:hypothetical protein
MHSHEPREDPLTDMGYETRDINIAGIRTTAILFFLFSFGCFVVVGVWFLIAKPPMGSELAPNKPMPPILLQSDSSVRADIASFRQAETQRLSTSGPNPDGTFHIPVDQALNIIAQRGLPHTETNTAATSPGNTIPQNAIGPGMATSPTAGGTPETAVPQPVSGPLSPAGRSPEPTKPVSGGTNAKP